MLKVSCSPLSHKRKSRWVRWPVRFLGLFMLLMLGPIGVLDFGDLDLDTPWHLTSQESTGQAPHPAVERRAVVQVYGARIVRWRGAFGIHPWIAVKRAGVDHYTTHHIVGWRARRGGDALVTNEVETPDMPWYGAYPQLLADHRGAEAEAMIDQIESAVAAYPWRASYRLWPGPNSNTFVAWMARQVPALRLDLPPPWRSARTSLARPPSSTTRPGARASRCRYWGWPA